MGEKEAAGIATAGAVDPTVPSAEGIQVPGLRFRRFAGDADLEGVTLVMRAGSRADGLSWFPTVEDVANELRNAPNEDPVLDDVVAEAGGRIVAYGRASWGVRDGRHVYRTSGEVDPAFRRRGIGRAILRGSQARLRDIATGHPDAVERVFAAEVMDGQDGARVMLERDGYRPVRWFAEMERSLREPIAPRPLPDGLEIRPFRDEDRRRVFEAEREAFRDHWGHREWTDVDFRWMFEGSGLELPLWRVAWDGDEVAGVVATYVYEKENEELGVRRGWLERVSVRRPWRKLGVASALMTSAMLALRERGLEAASLGVDTDNPSGAVGVYERLGFRRVRGAMLVERPLDLPGA